MIRPPFHPPIRNWRRTPAVARMDESFQAQVLSLFDRGQDTAQIAESMSEQENVIWHALRVAREARVRAKSWGGNAELQ